MDNDASESSKSSTIFKNIYREKSDSTTEEKVTADIVADIESDDENIDHPFSQSEIYRSNRSVKKRSSPVHIYTYKVWLDFFTLHML